jgi:hypothetical protein
MLSHKKAQNGNDISKYTNTDFVDNCLCLNCTYRGVRFNLLEVFLLNFEREKMKLGKFSIC